MLIDLLNHTEIVPVQEPGNYVGHISVAALRYKELFIILELLIHIIINSG